MIVTGARRGIGRAIAEAFIENGDNVWACCRHIDEDMTAWAADHTDERRWVRLIEMELCDGPSVQNGFKAILHDKLPVDVLVNAAGVGHMGLFQMTSFREIRELYEVNLFAAMQLCQLAIRPMSRQRSGIIINLSSTAAHEVYVGNSVYGASKAALSAFSASLAAELAPLGIRVNCVAPGLTDTDMSKIFEGNDASLPLMRSALGRKLRPEEIADVVVALTQGRLVAINGQTIIVNGGSK